MSDYDKSAGSGPGDVMSGAMAPGTILKRVSGPCRVRFLNFGLIGMAPKAPPNHFG